MLSFCSIFRSCLPISEQTSSPVPLSPPAPFEDLPLELLQQITEYLPLSSQVALRQTNSWLHVHGGFETPAALYNRLRNSRQDKLDFLCLLERAAPVPKRRVACSICVQWHPTDRFSTTELKNRPEVRTCQRAWICEHRTIPLAQYRKILDAPIDSVIVVNYPYAEEETRDEVRYEYWASCCHANGASRLFCSAEELGVRGRMLVTWWIISLRTLQAYEYAKECGLDNQPEELDVHVCPHRKLRQFIPILLPGKAEEAFKHQVHGTGDCRRCKAFLSGSFEEDGFRVMCVRWFGDGRAQHPYWLSQSLLPS